MTVTYSYDVLMIFMYWKTFSNLRNCAISGACFTAPSVSRLHDVESCNDELERIWKDAVVAQLRYNAGICLEGLRKSMKTSLRVADVLADTRAEQQPVQNNLSI